MSEALPTVRRRVFDILDQGSSDPLGKLIDRGLIALILLNVAVTIVESVPDILDRFERLLVVLEVFSVGVFTAEYAVRVWTAPESPHLREMPAWRARLRYAVSFFAIIDLLSIAPVYANLFTSTDLRSLLVLRLFRFFKLARYSPGLVSLSEAVWSERRALTACGVILLGTVLLTASAMRFAEQEAQPDKFGTIPDAMYWAFITLSTVGYGDVVPTTALGKAIASITAVIGIGMLALPVGILASSFADEIRRRDFVVTMTMVTKVPLFADLDAASVASIMRSLNARSFEPGEAIVRRGEPATAMFFISSGVCEVELRDNPVRLGAGDFFGEMGLLQDRPRNATVVAVSRAKLLALSSEDLKYIMDHEPTMAKRIREIAERRMQEAAAPPPDAAPSG